MTFCARKLCEACRRMRHGVEYRDGRWICPGCYWNALFSAACTPASGAPEGETA